MIDNDGFLTIKGKEVLKSVQLSITREQQKLERNVSKTETPFDRWWKTYPGTDTFIFNGKTFRGTRSFRKEKDECAVIFNRLLNSGKYTEEEMVEAIKLEVENRMEESYKSGENKLKYLLNTASYLRQYAYDAYVELVRKGIKSKESGSGGVTDFSI